jgi:LacI family transcriptional regulator
MPTLADISRYTGVSVATVSRVLNRNPQVAGESVALVRSAAEKLGYQLPPRHARHRGHFRATPRSTTRAKKQVALLFPDNQAIAMQTALSGRLMRSITQELAGREYSLVPTLLQPDGQLPSILRSPDVVGVIVRGAADITSVEPRLARMPCLWMLSLSRIPARGDQVADNAFVAGQLAAEHFLSLGHTRLAVLNHESFHPCYGPRTAGFVQTATHAGARVDLYQDAPIPELIDRLVTSPNFPQALFVPLPDAQLIPVHRLLEQRSIRPGTDLPFLGCSYDPANLSAMNPSLSNIEIHAEHIGRAAVDMLFWRLQNPTQPRRRLFITPSLQPPTPESTPPESTTATTQP